MQARDQWRSLQVSRLDSELHRLRGADHLESSSFSPSLASTRLTATKSEALFASVRLTVAGSGAGMNAKSTESCLITTSKVHAVHEVPRSDRSGVFRNTHTAETLRQERMIEQAIKKQKVTTLARMHLPAARTWSPSSASILTQLFRRCARREQQQTKSARPAALQQWDIGMRKHIRRASPTRAADSRPSLPAACAALGMSTRNLPLSLARYHCADSTH